MKLTKNSRTGGFTLVEIMIVVAIIGLLAAIAIPNFVNARQKAQCNACINNLRQIDSAKQQWALEKGKATSATPGTADLVGTSTAPGYIGKTGLLGKDISCPLGTKGTAFSGYVIGNMSTLPTCSNYKAITHMASLDPSKQ
jgi:prepilin-type N-terminal cleavage/methylation domain-containing protein